MCAYAYACVCMQACVCVHMLSVAMHITCLSLMGYYNKFIHMYMRNRLNGTFTVF